MARRKRNTVTGAAPRTVSDDGGVVTQRDIALYCGLDQSTISRVLHGDPRIAGKTVEQVMAAAEALGYDPSLHAAARRLVARRHGRTITNDTVAVSMHPNFMSYRYHASIFRGLSNTLVPEGFALLVTNLPAVVAGRLNAPAILQRGEVDGLITDSEHPDATFGQLQQIPGFAGKPMVAMIHHAETCSCVVTDDRGGACEAARHLLALGHRHFLRIGTTLAPEPDSMIADRITGIRQALTEYGLDPEVHLFHYIVTPDWLNPLWSLDEPSHATPEQLAAKTPESLADYLRAHPQITAIFAANDSCALKAWAQLAASGISVPEDVSLIGFDDIDPKLDEQGRNLLTSVRLPLIEVGETAAQLILRQIREHTIEQRTVTLPAELVIRHSTAVPAAARVGLP